MTVKETWAWKFTALVTDSCAIRCPDCGELSPLADWQESEVCCEDCGSHAAMKCPRCSAKFDHVWGPTFEVRNTNHEAKATP